MSTIGIVVRAYERIHVLHLKMNLAIRQAAKKSFSQCDVKKRREF